MRISATGDKEAGNEEADEDTFELWMRDPVEAIRDLLGNPAFKDHL